MNDAEKAFVLLWTEEKIVAKKSRIKSNDPFDPTLLDLCCVERASLFAFSFGDVHRFIRLIEQLGGFFGV